MATPGQNLRAYLGVNTRRARERVGLTQSDLAEQVGREPLTIQRFEAGSQGTIDLVAQIAEALGVTPGSLCRPVKVVRRKAGRPRRRTE